MSLHWNNQTSPTIAFPRLGIGAPARDAVLHSVTGPILVPVVAKEKEFPSLGDAPDRAGFPSLGAAAAVKDSKKERRKKQTMSLADFVSTVDAPKPGTFVPSARVGGSALRRPLNDDDILRNLPTTSRGKVEGDEKPGDRLGGSFRDYGGDRAGGKAPIWGGRGRIMVYRL